MGILQQALAEAVGQETNAKVAADREAERLKKEPFKTMVKPTHEETVDALRGWVEPRGAYVLFERKKYLIQQDTSIRVGWGIKTLWLEDRPEQSEKIRYYQSKGYKIIHYAKFPSLNDENPKRRERALMYSQGTGINPWDEIKKLCEREIRGDSELRAKLAQVETEKRALEVKFQAEMEKKNVKNTGTNTK